MSVTVTLHVFSGVPDPAWELTDAQAQELADRIARIDKTTLLKPPGIVGGLGYRGFSVQSVREKLLAPHMYLHSGVVDLERFDANLLVDSSDLEEWLLSTAGAAVEPDVAQFVKAELSGSAKAISPAVAPQAAILAEEEKGGRESFHDRLVAASVKEYAKLVNKDSRPLFLFASMSRGF